MNNDDDAGSNFDEVQPIPELGQKISKLNNWAVGKPGQRDLTKLRGLERATGIPYGTLQSNINNCRISIKNQIALADAFKFSPDWPEWHGSADAFFEKFLAHKKAVRPVIVEAKLTKSHLHRQLADFAFGVAGSFESEKEAGGIRLVVSLSFDQRGWSIFHDLTVGLNEVDLQIECDRDGSHFDAFPIDCSSSEEGNFDSRANGTGNGYAYWTIKSADTENEYLYGNRRRNDGKDCICGGLSKGDRIRAFLTARRVDCFGTISGKSISTSSATKKRFIQHVTKLAIQNNNPKSDILLAEQTLTVVAQL